MPQRSTPLSARAGSSVAAQLKPSKPSLVDLPKGRFKRLACLHLFIDPLVPGERLSAVGLDRHLWTMAARYYITTDHCHLRRYMLSAQLLRREIDGSAYWRNPESPLIVR